MVLGELLRPERPTNLDNCTTFATGAGSGCLDILSRIYHFPLLSPSWAGIFWLVGCFGFNGPLRQYFSLYRAASQREGDRGEKG